jgi:ATP-dependent RNA helicase DDX54/DBP10
LALLYLLQEVIPEDQQTIVFAATRHHVEYLQVLLDMAKVSATYIYSNLDPSARKINAAKFSAKKCSVLVVTDLAARGIDIPLLDNVINYNFPSKSKLFVHRVGRVARAGRTGIAYSLIAGDEMAYYVDLQLFLGGKGGMIPMNPEKDLDWHGLIGKVPQTVNDEYSDLLHNWHQTSVELANTLKVSENGYTQYLKSRPGASVESVKRAKELKKVPFGAHPVMVKDKSNVEADRMNILEQMKRFRPSSTIFEIGNTTKNKKEIAIMNEKRKKHSNVIEQAAIAEELKEKESTAEVEIREKINNTLDKSSQDDIANAFDTVIEQKPKDANRAFPEEPRKKKLKKTTLKDETNFIPYQSSDHHAEAGYSMLTGFSAQAGQAVLDLTGENGDENLRKKVVMK